MVNQQKQVHQETTYNAVVVKDHMYPRTSIIFDPKLFIGLYRQGREYINHSLQLHYRQFECFLLH